MFFFYRYGDHRDLHGLTHSFPTRRSSDQHARLGFSDDQIESWFADAGLELERVEVLPGQELTVQLWLGRRRGARVLPIEGRLSARSEEHTSELQSLMRISYAVFCLKNKNSRQLTHIDTIFTTVKTY